MNAAFEQIVDGIAELLNHGGQLLFAVLAVLAFLLAAAWIDGIAWRDRGERNDRPRPARRRPPQFKERAKS